LKGASWKLFFVFLVLFHTGRAEALEGESSLVLGINYFMTTTGTDATANGFGPSLGYRFDFKDDFRLVLALSYGGYSRGFDHLSASVGIAYIIDALVFAPYIYALLGYAGRGSKDFLKPDFMITLGAGIEYRRYKRFGFGLDFSYANPVVERQTKGILSTLLFVAVYF
jgi:hypothetical protein